MYINHEMFILHNYELLHFFMYIHIYTFLYTHVCTYMIQCECIESMIKINLWFKLILLSMIYDDIHEQYLWQVLLISFIHIIRYKELQTKASMLIISIINITLSYIILDMGD